MLKSLMIVGCGSFVGGALRYLLTRTVQNWFDGWMPAGTLAVNVLGCLLIGLFCGLSQEWMPQSLKLFPDFDNGTPKSRIWEKRSD